MNSGGANREFECANPKNRVVWAISDRKISHQTAASFPSKNEAAICLSPPADAELRPTHTTAEVDTDRRSGELNANSERESRYFSAILRPRR